MKDIDSVTEFDTVLPPSSYNKGLPSPMPNESARAPIKMLSYWEKNIIPKIITFVKSTYRPWEMTYYFEQLRFHSNQELAVSEALVMCDKKIPQGCIIPDENHDWNAKIPEECIVGQWGTAKLNFNIKSKLFQQHRLV
jgi:hypothetical protein